MPTPRQLSTAEVAEFLIRHPVISGWVVETEAIMQAGLYDYNYNPALEWKLPGVIPPWGIQQEDSKYGLVTIFPAHDGTWRYSGYTYDAGTDKPDYESPLDCEGSGMVEVGGICLPKPPDLSTILILAAVGIGLFLYFNKKG